jgi:hypothetical protein
MITKHPRKPDYTTTEIYGGQVSFGRDPNRTSLGSCISIILLSDTLKIGGLSHIVGHEKNNDTSNLIRGPHVYPNQVLDEYCKYIDSYHITDPNFYIVGGSNRCPQVLEMTENELIHRQITYTPLMDKNDKPDLLGQYWRQVILLPEKITIKLFRKIRE